MGELEEVALAAEPTPALVLGDAGTEAGAAADDGGGAAGALPPARVSGVSGALAVPQPAAPVSASRVSSWRRFITRPLPGSKTTSTPEETTGEIRIIMPYRRETRLI
ncbi:hypothetical protein [Actinoplanes sp. NPDC049802]|uniref:hypothetical protein n=1 Tax=Actinoplanes sp. NPDC049802 TaxID=3154742 RepID=UPI00340693BA